MLWVAKHSFPIYVKSRLKGLDTNQVAEAMATTLWEKGLQTTLQSNADDTTKRIIGWKQRYQKTDSEGLPQQVAVQMADLLIKQIKQHPSEQEWLQLLALGFETTLSGGFSKGLRILHALPALANTPAQQRPMRLAEAMGPLWVRLLQSSKTASSLTQLTTPIIDQLDFRTQPIPYKTVKALIEKDFKRPLRHLFSSFEPEPVAVSSFAQFHKATIISGRQTQSVLVKLIKPQARPAMAEDIQLLEPLQRLLKKAYPHVDFSNLFDPMLNLLHPETHMPNEAKLRALIAASNQSQTKLYIPQAIATHTANRVLTTPWVEATPLSDLSKTQQKAAVASYLSVMLDQLFKSAVFPADPHPGHFALPKQPNTPWVLRNACHVGTSTLAERQLVARFLGAVYTRNVPLVAQLILPPNHGLSSQRFEQLVTQLTPVIKQPVQRFKTVAQWQQWASTLMQTAQNMGDLPVQLPHIGLMTALITTLMTAKDIDPDLSIWDATGLRIVEQLAMCDPVLLSQVALARAGRFFSFE
jgi:ubiquinone biosynthesis protein